MPRGRDIVDPDPESPLALALAESGQDLIAQMLLGRLLFRHREVRQDPTAGLDLQLAHAGDQPGVANRLRDVREDLRHLARGAEEVGIARHLHALRIVEGLAGLHADQDVLDRHVVLIEVVDVGGTDKGQAQILAQFDHAAIDDLLLGDRGVVL